MPSTDEIVGTALGAGGTIALRELADDPTDDSLTRPSVLFGVGGGTAAAAASYWTNSRRLNVPRGLRPYLVPFAISALSAGLTSAMYPKGATSASMPSMQMFSARQLRA